MTTLFRRIWTWGSRPEVPQTVLAPPPQPAGYPRTYKVPRIPDARIQVPEIFDPALRQFGRAFRNGEPTFPDEQTGRAWRAARRRVMDHLLALLCASPWGEQLVLRGSLVLTAWLGEKAREPGDIDWVVTPAAIALTDSWNHKLFKGLRALLAQERQAGDVTLLSDELATEDIWTYERAPGRRLLCPWLAPGLPPGVVQMDFVFGEPLVDAPVATSIPTADGGSTTVQTVSRELSLAWKLMWLESDSYPQGKDLYDATLLAECGGLSLPLLQAAFASREVALPQPLDADFPLRWAINDWESFQLEYPEVQGTDADWQARLATALRPLFAQGRLL